MPARTFRAALIAILAVAALGLTLPGTAAAVAPVTQITAPATGSFLLAEEGRMLKVKGTAAAGVTEVDIRCYYWPTEYNILRFKLPVASEAFEVEIPTTSISADACQLRAIPSGLEPKELGPGQESENAQKYSGPLLATSYWTPEPESHNFFASATTFAGAIFLESAGSYAFESDLFSSTEHADEFDFYGELNLKAMPPIATRASLQVDSVNAYVPADLKALEFATKGKISGAGQPVLTKTFNEATRQFTVHEEDPVYYCAPEAAKYPPTKTSCTSLVPAGVTVVRDWQTVESKVALVTESWHSTNGAAHTIDVRYYNEMHSGNEGGGGEGGAYMFPGEASFAATAKEGETRTLPAGPGMILYKTGPAVAEAGDGIHPQVAWVYDRSPSGPLTVQRPSSEPEYNSFELPYQYTVPAGGSSAPVRMAFAQSFSLTEARALAEGALASFHPTVTISSPANGSSIISTNPTVTVAGTAADTIGVSSLTVNGKAVPVGAGGAWSAAVTLTPGANTITAVAGDSSGLTASAAVQVNYSVPPARGKVSGSPSGRNGKITVTLLCTGVTGQSCKIALNASTLERLSHGHIRSVSARNRRVTVASSTITLKAGQRITVSLGLNGTGRRLLARFHRLPVTLKGSLVPAAGKPTAILNTRLTVKPKPKPKHHHH